MITAAFDQTMISTGSVAWLEVLLSISAKGLLILLMAALLSFALRKASAASRHLVWSLALASLLALPVLAFGLPSFDAPVLPLALYAESTDNQPIAFASQAHEAGSVAPARQLPASRALAALPVASAVYGKQSALARPASLGWATWALMIWLAGALLILARLLVGTASVKRMARNAEPIEDEEWLAVSALLAYRVGLRRQILLLRSRSVTMPLTFGALKSAILLPAEAQAWSDERREVVLLHELAHVKRRDCLTQLLAQVACAIYWFNPLIWSASRNLRAERERACDDQVLDAGTRASDYADHLLDIARRLGSSNCASLAAVAIARRSQLEGRLLAILDPSVRRRGLSRIASLAVGLAVISVLLPLACLHPAVKAQAKHYERAESKITINAQSKITLAETVALNSQLSQNQKADFESITTPVSMAEAPAAPDFISPVSETSNESAPAPQAIQSEQNGQSQQPAPQPSPTPATRQERESAAEALAQALKDEDPEVREQALFALANIDGPRATEALIAALKDANAQVRQKAAWGLGMRHGDALIDPLINALKDSDAEVRQKAAWALGMNGTVRAIEPLADALRDENEEVREQAAWALGLKGDARAVEPLINALKDSSPQVRQMAAWALGMRGDKRAMKALNAAMKDQDKEVRGKATWALGMMLMRNGDSVSDNDRDFDFDFDGRGAGSGSGSGAGTGAAGGKGSGTGKSKARP